MPTLNVANAGTAFFGVYLIFATKKNVQQSAEALAFLTKEAQAGIAIIKSL